MCAQVEMPETSRKDVVNKESVHRLAVSTFFLDKESNCQLMFCNAPTAPV